LGNNDLQLSLVQEPCHDNVCALFASAKPGLLGVVDKEQKMNNLYFTLSQRFPTGLLSRKNIPGLQSQHESICQAQPIVPFFTLYEILTRQKYQAAGFDYCFFILVPGKKDSFYHSWRKLHFLSVSFYQNDPNGR
jgi:hypothetical protein